MSTISVVVPDGSMEQVVVTLFENAGLPITVERKRTKEGVVAVDWISRVVFQRPQEIPHYLSCGHFDVAVVGEDWIADWGYVFPVLFTMPIGRGGTGAVMIVLAVSQASGFQDVEDLPQGCEVATEYARLTKRFFLNLGRDDIVVVQSFGNTEHKIRFGAAAIVDVVESGSSLRENGLKSIATIMESSMVIVANSESFADADKRQYIDCLARLINGAFQASKYVLLVANVPEGALEKACRIIGGLKGPSCAPLAGVDGWFALQSIVRRADEQRVIFALLQLGIDDIFVHRDIPLLLSQHNDE